MSSQKVFVQTTNFEATDIIDDILEIVMKAYTQYLYKTHVKKAVSFQKILYCKTDN